MAGTRALFASIGASVALVAAAALSLLAVSVVFAFGGWTDAPAESLREPELIFAGPTPKPDGQDAGASVQTASALPIVAAASAPKPTDASRRGDNVAKNIRDAGEPATRKPAKSTPTPGLSPPAAKPVAPAPAPVAVATARKASGDGVRKVGADLSSTVQGTGTALAQATAPLLPPISAAVQEVFNAVAALLTQTTQGLGGAVDKLLPPKK